jgi:uncharacterized protein DUF1524
MIRVLLIWLGAALVITGEVSAQRGYVSPPSTYTQNDSYDRSEWRHWIDADKDKQDTRQEVLIAESTVPVTFDQRGRVIKGRWEDPYTGRVFTDPTQLQVDHVVALGWAYYHGGWMWDKKKKQDYANDLDHPEHLIAVYGPANQAKGRLGPDDWKPENEAFWCDYGKIWVSITYRWDLSLTWREYAAIGELLATCPIK